MDDELLCRLRELNPVPDPDRFAEPGAPDWPADPVLRAVLEGASTTNHRPGAARRGLERDPAPKEQPMPTLTPPRNNGSARPEPRSRRGWLLNAAAVAAVVLAVGLIARFGPLDDDAIAPAAPEPAAPEPAAPEPEPDVEVDRPANGPDAPESVTFDTQLGSWTWTWIPEVEEAARRWQEASDNWEATGYVDVDPFPASIQDVSGVTTASWGNVSKWLDWNRVPWARLDTTTVATFYSGSSRTRVGTREDWHLVVDTGQGYEPHEVPWDGLPVMNVDLAVGSDGFAAVALVGDLATNDWNRSDQPPLLHRWGSADGIQWEELNPPLAVGDVRKLRLVGGHERLLLRLEGPEPSMLSSPDGVDWQQVGPEPITTDWHESVHTSTSYGWAMARAGDVVGCEIWMSADTMNWEQVPFQQAVEKRPVRDARDCRLVGDEVYVRLAKSQDTSTAMGLWIGRLDD